MVLYEELERMGNKSVVNYFNVKLGIQLEGGLESEKNQSQDNGWRAAISTHASRIGYNSEAVRCVYQQYQP
jgi:hypothetical protein